MLVLPARIVRFLALLSTSAACADFSVKQSRSGQPGVANGTACESTARDTALVYPGRALRVLASWSLHDTLTLFAYSTLPSAEAGVEHPTSRLVYLHVVNGVVVDSSQVIESAHASLFEPVRVPRRPSIRAQFIIMTPPGSSSKREMIAFGDDPRRPTRRSAAEMLPNRRARVTEGDSSAIRTAVAIRGHDGTVVALFGPDPTSIGETTLPFPTVAASAVASGDSSWLIAAATPGDQSAKTGMGIELVSVRHGASSSRTTVESRSALPSSRSRTVNEVLLGSLSNGRYMILWIEPRDTSTVVHAQELDERGRPLGSEVTVPLDMPVSDFRLDLLSDAVATLVPTSHRSGDRGWVVLVDPASGRSHRQLLDHRPGEVALSRTTHLSSKGELEAITSILVEDRTGPGALIVRNALSTTCLAPPP